MLERRDISFLSTHDSKVTAGNSSEAHQDWGHLGEIGTGAHTVGEKLGRDLCEGHELRRLGIGQISNNGLGLLDGSDHGKELVLSVLEQGMLVVTELLLFGDLGFFSSQLILKFTLGNSCLVISFLAIFQTRTGLCRCVRGFTYLVLSHGDLRLTVAHLAVVNGLLRDLFFNELLFNPIDEIDDLSV